MDKQISMNLSSWDRIEITLNHKEPDRIPFDFGSSLFSGISVLAYKNLLDYLGIKKDRIKILSLFGNLAEVDEDVLEKLEVDTRYLIPHSQSAGKQNSSEDENYSYITDEWGIVWRKPKTQGIWYDVYKSPLAGELTKDVIDSYPWPDPLSKERFKGLENRAKAAGKNSLGTIMHGWDDLFFNWSFLLRGFENFYIDLATNPSLACYLMDKLIELKMIFWESCFKLLGNHINIAAFLDDLGDQRGLRISPDMYRKYIKPRQKKIFSFIKSRFPKIYILLHSDGSLFDIIPDLIEVGVQILNPIQASAANRALKKLKREFGNDIIFWGGGIDTQRILPFGTPQQVRDEVKRNIDDFAPGGGFVFAPVHNILDEVPPQNFMVMWESLKKFGKY